MVDSDSSGNKILGPPISERGGGPQNTEKLGLAFLLIGCF